MNHLFHEQLLGFELGEISKPFEIARRLYIMEVLERTEPVILGFAQANPIIEEVVIDRKHRTLASDLQKRLLKQSEGVVYPAVLEGYLKKHAQPGAREKPKD